jgi:hypothetical protein
MRGAVFSKVWNDPVWSKVISGVILAIGATGITYFLNWWPTIGNFFACSYAYIHASTTVPRWFILLVGLLALPTAIFLPALLWRTLFPLQASWKSYRSDLFFGIRWRWNYFGSGEIYDVHTFCPRCDFQLYAKDSYRSIVFFCESCDQHLGAFDETYDSLENKTKRFIQQKLRNGTWSAAVTASGNAS